MGGTLTPMADGLDRRGLALRYRVSATVVLLLLWASSAPSVLYPLWGAKYDLSPLVQTGVYACYPFALILVLLFGGGISDRIGRRNGMLLGMGVLAVASLLLTVAWGLDALLVARILQGFGTGLALGASNASIIENEPDGDAGRAASTISVASAGGLILGPILTGTLVQYGPWPLHLSLSILTALIVGSLILLVSVRGAGGASIRYVATDRWRPQTISVPREILAPFGLAALAVTASYAGGALALSLGAQMARELVATSNALVIGLLLAVTPLGIGGVALAARRVVPAAAMITGGVVAAAGLSFLLLTAATGWFWTFVVALALNGTGQGLLVVGGLGLITLHAPGNRRGQTISAVYLVAYLGQGVTALVVGQLSTRLDIHRALEIFAPVMIAACLASAVLALRSGRPGRVAQRGG